MTSPSQPITGLTYEDVQRMITEQLAQRDAQHAEEIKALQDQIAAMTAAMSNRGVVTLVPAHGAGPGIEVADTWSQWEQELSRLGLDVPIHEYIKRLEGVDGGNILQRVQRIEKTLEEVAAAAHSHQKVNEGSG